MECNAHDDRGYVGIQKCRSGFSSRNDVPLGSSIIYAEGGEPGTYEVEASESTYSEISQIPTCCGGRGAIATRSPVSSGISLGGHNSYSIIATVTENPLSRHACFINISCR
jgi:hypothetical protein